MVLAGLSLFVVHFWTWISHVYLMRVLEKPQPQRWFLRAMLLSQVLGMLAPGKIGDLSIAWFLRKRGVAYGEGLAIGMFYKMVALAVTFWLGLTGLAGWTSWTELLAFMLVLPLGLFAISHVATKWIIPVLPRLLRQPRLIEEMRAFNQAWKTMGAFKPMLMSLLLALLKAMLMTIAPWLILMAFGHPLSFSTTLALSSVARLASAIPLSPAGLGVRELSGTLVFSEWAGIPWAVAANMMLISTVLQYGVAAICYGVSFSALSESKEKAG